LVAPTRTTLTEAVEPWLGALDNQGRKPSTLQGYRRVFANHVLPRLGGTPLQELRAADLDALYAELLRSGRRGGGGLALTTSTPRGTSCSTAPSAPASSSATSPAWRAPRH
jgi:hypothetical protein